MQYKTIFEPVFHTQVTFIKGKREKCENFLNRKFKPAVFELDTYAATYTFDDEKNFRQYVLWLSPEAIKSKRNRNNTLAHESGHVAIKTLLAAGVTPEYDNHEPFCYLLGWVTGEAHDFFLE